VPGITFSAVFFYVFFIFTYYVAGNLMPTILTLFGHFHIFTYQVLL